MCKWWSVSSRPQVGACNVKWFTVNCKRTAGCGTSLVVQGRACGRLLQHVASASPADVLFPVCAAQVVSHSSFLHFMMTNYGGQASMTVQGELHRWFENCEWQLWWARLHAVDSKHFRVSLLVQQVA